MQSKTFRLFLSSTFNDLRAERDKLQAEVFPRLRKYCEEKGFSFQAIDLRWGVSSEAGNDQKTMQICIDEVKRCKNALNPHFAIMLGERYGWIPLPATVEAKEFELVKQEILKEFSNNNDVIEYINFWYKKDENAIPNVYKLQPKIDPKHQEWEYWLKVETALRDAFSFVVNNNLKDKLNDNQKFKYIKSATEQEIIEGLFENQDIAKDNIYFYNRNFENIDDINSKEFELLEKKDKEYNKKDSTYSITIKHFSDFKNFSENVLDEKIRPYHEELINKINSTLPKDNIKTYDLKLDVNLERTQDSVTNTYLNQFANDFEETIMKSIKSEIEAFESVEISQRELDEQKSFMKQKSEIFVGREDIIKNIESYIDSKEKYPLVIYAPSGAGKSALMAKLVDNQIKKEVKKQKVIYRFVGISQLSVRPIDLLGSIYNQLVSTSKIQDLVDEFIEEKDIKIDDNISVHNLSKLLKYILSNYPKKSSLVLFVDSLDQFVIKDELKWLPSILPKNVKIILSTLPLYNGIDYLPRLQEKFKNSNNFLELELFRQDEAKDVIDQTVAKYNRTLNDEQRQKILDSFTNGNILHLKILIEESLEWNSYDVINEEYPQKLEDLIQRLFINLYDKSHHSLPLIKHSFSYIACSKYGLSEAELFDILSAQKDIMDNVSNQFYPRPLRLPTAVWARLFTQVSHYLATKENNGIEKIMFFHRKFNEGAYELLGSKEIAHKNLADFFEDVYKNNKEAIKTAVLELPYQLINSNQHQKAVDYMIDFDFIMKKLSFDKIDELLEDYELIKGCVDNTLICEEFKLFYSFLKQNELILKNKATKQSYEKKFFVKALEHSKTSPITKKALEYEPKANFLYLKNNNIKDDYYHSNIVEKITFDYLQDVTIFDNKISVLTDGVVMVYNDKLEFIEEYSYDENADIDRTHCAGFFENDKYYVATYGLDLEDMTEYAVCTEIWDKKSKISYVSDFDGILDKSYLVDKTELKNDELIMYCSEDEEYFIQTFNIQTKKITKLDQEWDDEDEEYLSDEEQEAFSDKYGLDVIFGCGQIGDKVFIRTSNETVICDEDLNPKSINIDIADCRDPLLLKDNLLVSYGIEDLAIWDMSQNNFNKDVLTTTSLDSSNEIKDIKKTLDKYHDELKFEGDYENSDEHVVICNHSSFDNEKRFILNSEDTYLNSYLNRYLVSADEYYIDVVDTYINKQTKLKRKEELDYLSDFNVTVVDEQTLICFDTNMLYKINLKDMTIVKSKPIIDKIDGEEYEDTIDKITVLENGNIFVVAEFSLYIFDENLKKSKSLSKDDYPFESYYNPIAFGKDIMFIADEQIVILSGKNLKIKEMLEDNENMLDYIEVVGDKLISHDYDGIFNIYDKNSLEVIESFDEYEFNSIQDFDRFESYKHFYKLENSYLVTPDESKAIFIAVKEDNKISYIPWYFNDHMYKDFVEVIDNRLVFNDSFGIVKLGLYKAGVLQSI
jgi:hypothetical protein